MRRLVFGASLVQLAAGVIFCASLSIAASVTVKQSSKQIDVSIDGRPFTTYYFDPAVTKPYLMPLRTASGIIVTRNFPVGNDASQGDSKASAFEPHQRPLFFGFGDLDGLNFWAEQVFDRYYPDLDQPYGHMLLKRIEEAASDGPAAKIRARFTLNDPSNRVIAEETQSFTFRGDSRTRTIDCEFVLYATAGPLVIGDTKEGTFAIRVAPELSSPLGRMTSSNGAEGEKAIWGKTADWVDYSGTISGQLVGIAVFDSTKSFRHPTTWHARAYGLLAANPFGLREFTADPSKEGGWTVPEGGSISFRYRVFIHQGDFGSSQISAAYKKYAGEQ